MKRIGIIATILVLAVSLCACRRKENIRPTETMPAITEPPTSPTVLPQMDPTMETNIPDPSVEATTHNEETTANNEATDTTDGTGETGDMSRGRRMNMPNHPMR